MCSKYLSIFIVIFIHIKITFSGNAGSLYTHYSTADSDICSLIKTRKLTVGEYGSPGIIVDQSTLSDHSVDWDKIFMCKFQIKVGNFITRFRNDHSEGIVAVIQHFSLRKDHITGDCIDFILFRTHDGTLHRFCGKTSPQTDLDMSENFNRAVVDHFGQLDTGIYIDKKKLEPNETTEFSIVFTAFKSCIENDKYLPCSEVPNICIRREFFNDSYINCPFPNCADEGGCNLKVLKISSGIGTKVALSAVGSLVLGFIIFLLCLWLCRKSECLCWSTDCTSGPQPHEVPQNIEFSDPTSMSLPGYHQAQNLSPSAPRVEAKDLPPSYDSLFPNR